jgi:hypothetical protein
MTCMFLHSRGCLFGFLVVFFDAQKSSAQLTWFFLHALCFWCHVNITFLLLFLVVLGFELSASHLIDRYSIT